MTQPLVSCIVPVFNGERYVRETVDSIFAQTYRPLEIIVADDGSHDDSAAIIKRYGRQVNYLWQPNAGPAAARNLGLSAATGDLIAFLDADDLWHPTKLARQWARFRTRPELELCLTRVKNFWSPEFIEERQRVRDQDLVVVITTFMLSSVLARRHLFDTVAQFKPELFSGEDTDWFTRVINHGSVYDVLPDLLVHRRLHRDNASRGMNVVNRDVLLQRVKEFIDQRRGLNKTRPLSGES